MRVSQSESAHSHLPHLELPLVAEGTLACGASTLRCNLNRGVVSLSGLWADMTVSVVEEHARDFLEVLHVIVGARRHICDNSKGSSGWRFETLDAREWHFGKLPVKIMLDGNRIPIIRHAMVASRYFQRN
jgi:hypothetical protein